MKISYNWLKWYIPNIPAPEKLSDIFTYHLCEVESIENLSEFDDTVFDINILPNRAHDLLSHQGIARELGSLLGLEFVDPTPKYQKPASQSTNLKIDIQTDKCRRYSARIVRNVSVANSPDWVVKHLTSIGQRSINNIVDATNLVMFDCGQPVHAFDLDKVVGGINIRQAKSGEELITLDNKKIVLSPNDTVIADDEKILAIAGVKGGKAAEVDENTKNIIIEIGNFDPVAVRKTRRAINLFTDAAKRFENDLSPELCDFAMLEMSGLISEYGFNDFEDVVDVYYDKQPVRTLKFRLTKISSMLGYALTNQEASSVLERYHFKFSNDGDVYEIEVPALRLDLQIEEDMAEEFGRILGYDRVVPVLPQIAFTPKQNEIFQKITSSREALLSAGYSEVMTYTFCDQGEVEVLASASDKKYLRTNLTQGLKESIKQNNLNAPLLGVKEVRVFEIGKVFTKDGEKWHIAYGDKKNVTEVPLHEFSLSGVPDVRQSESSVSGTQNSADPTFKMWSLYPFIVRDIALWVPENISIETVKQVIQKEINDLVIKGPDVFDTFTKEGRTSYAFRLVFQAMDRTLTDVEVGEVMEKINQALRSEPGWELR